MEIFKDSQFLESSARHIASQPQSRAQVMEIPFQEKTELSPVEFGEIILTVLKGEGTIETGEGQQHQLTVNDQVCLSQGDAFALNAANAETTFVLQLFWSP